MDSPVTDIHAKYQRLANEYAKVRAQVGVLKKAVTDEQVKSTECKEMLKESEQRNRKTGLEMESLTFRNQQLTKRVEVLQVELDSYQRNHYKKSKANSTEMNNASALTVIREDLQCKIDENARLHELISDAEQIHRQSAEQMAQDIKALEKELQGYRSVNDATKAESDCVVKELISVNERLQSEFKEQEKFVWEAKLKVEFYETKLRGLEEQLGNELKSARDVLQEKLPFNDTRNPLLNSLNLPANNKQVQKDTVHFISQLKSLISEFVSSMSNFYAYFEQTLVPTSDSQSEAIVKVLKEYLHTHTTYMKPVRVKFEVFYQKLEENNSEVDCEVLEHLNSFATVFHEYYGSFHSKIMPYVNSYHRFQSTNNLLSDKLKSKYCELNGCFNSLNSGFGKTDTYLRAFVGLLGSRDSEPNRNRVVQKLTECIRQVDDLFRELCRVLTEKVFMENELPTVTEQLRTTNECLLNSAVAVSTCLKKFRMFLAQNSGFLKSSASVVWCKGRTASTVMSPQIRVYRGRNSDYLELLDKNVRMEPGVPYKEAIKNKAVLSSSAVSAENLSQQLSSCHDKMRKLEQQKEHWMLECQLLQLKHDKELKKIKEADGLAAGRESSIASSHSTNSSTNESSSPILSTNSFPPGAALVSNNKAEYPLSPVGFDEALLELKEQDVKRYFTRRFADLASQTQTADSKSVGLQTELGLLQKRLRLVESQKKESAEKLIATTMSLERLNDELAMTSSNYESQLRTMSEHLANMNDKLTNQRDEIDELKYELSNRRAGKK